MPFAPRAPRPAPTAAFTMVEIALSLAVIGFAIVAILGVLPIGLDVQKNNRRETIVNQDANYFVEAIRGGARGLDDLTNYVQAIIISNMTSGGVRTYTNPFNPPPISLPLNNPQSLKLTNGQIIIGLLSTPKFIPGSSASNLVAAYVQAISGAATEKSPQANDIIREMAFSYRMVSELVSCGSASNGFFHASWTNFASANYINPPTPANITTVNNKVNDWADALRAGTNANPDVEPYLGIYTNLITDLPAFREVTGRWLVSRKLQANLYDLRLLFRWPVFPGQDAATDLPKLGNGFQAYRAMLSGSIEVTNGFYFMRSQSYINTP